MSQGLQAAIAAAALTVLVVMFFGIHILFRRFLMRDRTKGPGVPGTRMEKEKPLHKKLKLRKKAG
ncbi:MAG: hypothetical protein V3W51_05335 [Candidatus Brocadiales bacterium]